MIQLSKHRHSMTFVRKSRQKYHIARLNIHSRQPINSVQCSGVTGPWHETTDTIPADRIDQICSRCANSVFGWRWHGIKKDARARREDAETALMQARAERSAALEYVAYVDAYTDTSKMSDEQRKLYDALWIALVPEENDG